MRLTYLLAMIPAVICGLFAAYFDWKREEHRKPGVPYSKVMFTTGFENPDLYTETGKRYARLSFRFTVAAIVLALVLGGFITV